MSSALINGWNAGEQMYSNRMDRERQAREDEWRAQERKYQQDERDRLAAERKSQDGVMSDVYNRAQNFTDTASPVINEWGLTQRPQVENPYADANPRSGAYAQRQGAELLPQTTPTAVYGEPVKAPVTGSPKRETLLQGLALAKSSRNVEAMLRYSDALRQDDLSANVAAVQNAVMNAPEAARAKFAQGFTDMKHFPGKIVTDPKTGVYTVALDSGSEVKMSNTDLARFAAGTYKLRMGDQSGQADIDAIDKKLGEAASSMFDKLAKRAQTNNNAINTADQMRDRQMRYGLAAAGEGRAREAANKPDFVQMTNDKGEVVFVDRRKLTVGNDGIAAVPPGVRAQKLPQQLSDEQKLGLQAYYKSLTDAPPQTPAEADQRKATYGVQGLAGAPSGGMPGWGEATAQKPKTAPNQNPAGVVAQPVQRDPLQPTSQAEHRALQVALQRGLFPVGRGNSALGAGELLFADKQGNKVWASQLGQ